MVWVFCDIDVCEFPCLTDVFYEGSHSGFGESVIPGFCWRH